MNSSLLGMVKTKAMVIGFTLIFDYESQILHHSP